MFNIQPPINLDKPVIGSQYFSAENAVTIQAADVGLNARGVKLLPAGLFLSKVLNKVRFLPRDRARTAVLTTSTVVGVNYPELFQPGDRLVWLESDGTFTLGASLPGDIIRIRLIMHDGRVETAAFTQSGANLTALIPELVSFLNSNECSLKKIARFEATGTAGQIRVCSQQFFQIRVDTRVASTGVWTPLVSTSITQMQANASQVAADLTSTLPRHLGIVQSVDFANRNLILAANAGFAVSVGGAIGVTTDEIYGIYNHSVDFTDRPYLNLKVIDRCDRVYANSLPYLDTDLVQRFPRLKFVY